MTGAASVRDFAYQVSGGGGEVEAYMVEPAATAVRLRETPPTGFKRRAVAHASA